MVVKVTFIMGRRARMVRVHLTMWVSMIRMIETKKAGTATMVQRSQQGQYN